MKYSFSDRLSFFLCFFPADYHLCLNLLFRHYCAPGHLQLQGSDKKKKSTTAWWHSRNVGHISVLSEPSLFAPLLHRPLCLPHIHFVMRLTSSSFLYSLISLFTHFKVSFNFLPVSSQCMSSSLMRENYSLDYSLHQIVLHYITQHMNVLLLLKKKSLFVCDFLNKDLM